MTVILRMQGINKNTIPDLPEVKITFNCQLLKILTANKNMLEYPDKRLLHDMIMGFTMTSFANVPTFAQPFLHISTHKMSRIMSNIIHEAERNFTKFMYWIHVVQAIVKQSMFRFYFVCCTI